MRNVCWIPAVVLGFASALTGQTLSPREVFYGESPAPAAKPPVKKTKPPAPTASASAPPPKKESSSYQTVAYRPLGLKYTVTQRQPDGAYVEVDPDSAFHSGDKIRLNVESNGAGYLYVAMQGSSGVWRILYPSAEAGRDNRLQPGHKYTIPASSVFTFDERAGTEKLFVVLSREPESDLESLLYSLQGDQKPKPDSGKQMMMAQNSVVERLRDTYSRDLVIEKVDDTKKPPPPAEEKAMKKANIPDGEKAVYVVNPTAGPNARVVADIELHHQ